uniref:Bcl10-interacting CARD protein-like n=1 Tax=Oncorhynchus kisutch TaxID=8019 RepID=A0A8C7GI79_ONCKI
MAAPWSCSDGYHVQLQRDSQFLCSDQRMHTELVDKLVLQLNRTYPQILTDKEAQRFRNLSVPTVVRLAELLVHLQGKGEVACHEFYRGLQIHAYNVYFNLPTRVSRRRGPLFFLSCFSLAVGLALLYYYGGKSFIQEEKVSHRMIKNTLEVDVHCAMTCTDLVIMEGKEGCVLYVLTFHALVSRCIHPPSLSTFIPQYFYT